MSAADAEARAAAILATADPVLVTCHLGPDGDAVGSMVALAALLREQGRQVTLYNPDLVPRHLKWLPHLKSLVHRLPATARFAATVVVDCGDPKLLGPSFPPAEITGPVVALDHHESGRPFGEVFFCDPQAASVGVLVARLAHRLGWPITRDAGLGLYVSLATDTGFFRYSNTNAEAFRLASELCEHGAIEPWEVSERLSEDVPHSRYRLLAAAIAAIELRHDGKVAFMTVTGEMLTKAQASWEDTDGLVNYARALRGVDCGVLITPAKRGGVRVSLRSKGKHIDAGKVCFGFGGGGHKGAAGCTIPGDLASARTTIEEALGRAIADSLAAIAAPPAEGAS